MKTIVTFAMLMSMAILSANAQSTDTGSGGSTSGSSIGIDLRPVFGGANGTNLQYQRSMGSFNLRLAAGLSGTSNDLAGVETNTYNHFLRGGIGFQSGSDKVSFNYGGDLVFGKEGTKILNGGTTTKESTTTIALRPFIGVAYQVTPRFSLSTEAYGSFGNYTTKQSFENAGVTTETTTDGISYQFVNGLRFYARYHF